jgi:hypothetical protein
VPTKNKPFRDLKSLARGYTDTAIRTLGGIAERGESEAARVTAAGMLLDRGWGKAMQVHAHGGAEGEGPIAIEIIHRERTRKK